MLQFIASQVFKAYLIGCLALSLMTTLGIGRDWAREHRVPFLVLDVQAVVATNSKQGYNHHGELVGVGRKNSVMRGDQVITVIVYNPMNNYEDDAIFVASKVIKQSQAD